MERVPFLSCRQNGDVSPLEARRKRKETVHELSTLEKEKKGAWQRRPFEHSTLESKT